MLSHGRGSRLTVESTHFCVILYTLTSLSSVFLAVVMTPVSGLMEKKPDPSKRVYLSLTWVVFTWSLSVAIIFPTIVPVQLHIITFLTVTASGQTHRDFQRAFFLFLTNTAFLGHSVLYRAFDCWSIVIHIIHNYGDWQRIICRLTS